MIFELDHKSVVQKKFDIDGGQYLLVASLVLSPTFSELRRRGVEIWQVAFQGWSLSAFQRSGQPVLADLASERQ